MIKLLSPQVIAQIAAGEVVERPASVIKELVENSLDAGACNITVEARGGGVELLRMTDDGCGIPAAEVELAFTRHATSKISDIADLNSIGTLGFRGEALGSIAAVSEVDLLTRTADEAMGTYISLKDGVVISKSGQARSPGTTITAKYLFHKVPARLKFLKSAPTENAHIADVISQYAMAYPEVRFSLSLGGKQTLRTPGSGRLLDGIAEIYGLEVASNMLEVNGTESGWESGAVKTIKISGMAGKPSVTRTGRGYLSFFVNRRWVNSRLLTWAVEQAYHGLLMQGRHPVAVINITIPPSELDANIHPTKTEVKFANENAVFTAVQKAVRRSLVQQAPIPLIEQTGMPYSGIPFTGISPVPGRQASTGKGKQFPPAVQAEMKSLPILRVLGQFAGNYIAAEAKDGIYIIDQHAAHERIRFEQIKEQRSKHAVEAQGLLEPAVVEVSPARAAVLKLRYADLVEFGFSIEPFGEKAFLVRTVPAILYDRDWQAMLRELLDGLESADNTAWDDEHLIALMACHSAIRAGQVLTENEMRELVRQLENEAMPRTCPHGRPIMLHLTIAQLEKEFGRV